MTTPNKADRKRPLTVKVRRGLVQMREVLDVMIRHHKGTEFTLPWTAQQRADVEHAIAWIDNRCFAEKLKAGQEGGTP